jgi:hypothetical protein
MNLLQAAMHAAHANDVLRFSRWNKPYRVICPRNERDHDVATMRGIP